MSIPTDMAKTCVVDSGEFAGWFAVGSVSENGPVNPASSVSFNSDHSKVGAGPNLCNFY